MREKMNILLSWGKFTQFAVYLRQIHVVTLSTESNCNYKCYFKCCFANFMLEKSQRKYFHSQQSRKCCGYLMNLKCTFKTSVYIKY